MTIAFWCVLIAGLMPIVYAGIAKAGDKSFNNRRPRDWYESITGYRRRAWWAQQNSLEAFPLFAAAVIIAQLADGTQSLVDALAIAFIAFRVAYGVCYLADVHLFRSLMWLGGLLCCIGLFIAAA
ncbi:hypothetical protein G4Y73_10790 [Wenzhouxiangella sp. XN201]|uniref:MAPEG family protein n=1 Tax=Wenzhouxiangella sp. XN201 TaxID=2710755 RepID=UPI0013C71644|nr:hypothetical protein [Wenzhouxiangella sp. XN201]